MQRSGWVVVLILLATGIGETVRAADDAQSIINKGINALGGSAKLTKAAAGMNWRAEGKLTVGGNENEFTIRSTVGGLDRVRTDFEGEFNGETFRGGVVLDGSKGWRKLGGELTDLEGDALSQEKRNQYLQIIPITLVPLLDKASRVEVAGEEKVGDQPAHILKIVGPDGKPFRLRIDKASGLPVKMTATVAGMNGDEYEQVTTFADYKEFGGLKKATKIDVTRDGQPFLSLRVREFQVAAPAADAFNAPK